MRTIQEAVRGYRRIIDPDQGEIILLLMQNGTYLQVPNGRGSKKPMVFFAAEEHTFVSDHSKKQGSAGDCELSSVYGCHGLTFLDS